MNPDTERIIQQAIDEGIAQAYAKGYFDGFVDALTEREKFVTKEKRNEYPAECKLA